MTTSSPAELFAHNSLSQKNVFGRVMQLLLGAVGLVSLIFVAGCQEPVASAPMAQSPKGQPEVQTVREGDVLKIAFPGAPTLDTTQQVRRDGRITMPVVGEVLAAGLTPNGLEQELLKLYASQLLSKEVSVTVVSSSFSIFVNGSVIRPGKIVSDHPISALEAVMEAGGFASTADMKAVVVIRQEGGQTHNYSVDLKLVLEGKQSEPFFLKPSDIVYVPEKFSWF
jgi:polysaccharide export outer membrane protein